MSAPKIYPTEGTSFLFGAATSTPDKQLCARSYQRNVGAKATRDRTTLCDTEIIEGYGLPNAGTFTFDFFMDPDNEAQEMLEEAYKDNSDLTFKHTMPNGYYRTATCKVTEFGDSGPNQGDYEGTVTIRVFGLTAWTAPAQSGG